MISKGLSNQFGNLWLRKGYRKFGIGVAVFVLSSRDVVHGVLRFIIRRKATNEGVGVALNFDVYDEPSEIELCQGIQYVLDMLGKKQGQPNSNHVSIS